MDEPLELTQDEKGIFKVGVTVAFAEIYGLPYETVTDYFDRSQIYDYLDKHSGLLITKMYPYVAELVAEEYGVPGS